MKNSRYYLIFLILTAAQIILCDFLNLSQYMVLSILPMLIMCLPIEVGTTATMVIAFVTGIAVDFFSTGMLGLTSLSLVPVALARRGIVVLVFGEEVYSRGENISMKRQGFPKMALGILISSAVYFTVFLTADMAGTRSFGFWLLRFFLSVLVSTVVSALLCSQLESD